MRETILIAALAVTLAGCDRSSTADPRSPDAADAGANAAAAGARQANEMVAAARADALEARVATLENQVDTLSAKVDTRADLGAALATQPTIAPPAVAPKLPYEAPTGASPN